MTEDEAKKKLCPWLKSNCIGSECMGWKWKRKILPFHIRMSSDIQKKYKNIEVIPYEGMQLITVLGGECKYLEEDKKK